MASAGKKPCPRIEINIIGTNKKLNHITVDHLKVLIQNNGNTVTIMPDICSDPNFQTMLIQSKNVRKSIEQLSEVWDEHRKQREEEISTDFVFYHQSLESLQTLSSILGSRARDEKSIYLIRRMYRRENEARLVDLKKENIFRIQLYIFDSEGVNEGEEQTLNAVIDFACKTKSFNRIFHYFHSDRPGEIWSRIYGLIQAEPKFAPLLEAWYFDSELCEQTRQNAISRKRKQFFNNASAVARYAESAETSNNFE